MNDDTLFKIFLCVPFSLIALFVIWACSYELTLHSPKWRVVRIKGRYRVERMTAFIWHPEGAGYHAWFDTLESAIEESFRMKEQFEKNRLPKHKFEL